VLLQKVDDAEQYCQQHVVAGPTASAAPPVLFSLVRLASRVLLPEPLGAMAFTDRITIGYGGGATFFSRFDNRNANVNGSLQFVQGPPNVVSSSTKVFPVKVKAMSGGGSPMELVEITLSIMDNNGVPAGIVGTFTRCDGTQTAAPAVGCTREEDGIAYFDLSISKAGGYIMCASASAAGFTFKQVCVPRINVRN
jgi:hypothetical protein